MEIKLKSLDEVITYEKLDNGLDVYLYTKDSYHNNYVTYTTKFGSIYNRFNVNDKEKLKVPPGIAHFLEHKVFAQKQGPEPMAFYARSGANSNAYTTFKNTTYMFDGPDNLKENITYLLDFVGSPYFTEENVAKEKGIITEEINMCNDRPIDKLYDLIRTTTLHNNPFKESIIGTVEDINKVTPELLLKCYNRFYNPENMFLVITGNFNKEEILKAIKDNQKNKKYDKFEKLDIKYDEPDEVVKKQEIVEINTDISKVAYNIKINRNKVKIDDRKISMYIYIIFNLLFGDTSKFDKTMKENNIITNTLGYNLLNVNSHMIISLINETDNYENLINNIELELQDVKISKNDFERKRRVLLSNEVFSFENISLINDIIVDNILYNNKVEDDIIGIINSLSLEELNMVISNISFKNKSIVVLKRKNS